MTNRARLTRYPERGSHTREALDRLLDETLLATISTVIDGDPWSIPTLVVRDGDRLLTHGSTGAGLLRHLASGQRASVTVATLDAIVVADSAFNSSANYRSAVLRGQFTCVPEEQKAMALRILTDRILPGRSTEVDPMTSRELAATIILEMPIVDGHWLYKARSGESSPSGRGDAMAWTGTIPMTRRPTAPLRDARVGQGTPLPSSVKRFLDQHTGPIT